MRKLIVIALALITVQAFAQPNQKQNKKQRMHKKHDFTPEQSATLLAKKMTLHLDLSEKQQAQVKNILFKNAKARKAKMEALKAKKESGELQKPTAEQRYEMANTQLDRQIAMNAEMKKILNNEQFEKWKKIQAKMAHRGKQKKEQGKNKMRQRKMMQQKRAG